MTPAHKVLRKLSGAKCSPMSATLHYWPLSPFVAYTLYTKYEVFSTTQLAQLEECQSAERETVSSNHDWTITNWSQKKWRVGIMPFLSSVQYASLGGDVGIKRKALSPSYLYISWKGKQKHTVTFFERVGT